MTKLTILKILLKIHKADTALLAPYLVSHGISHSLQAKYRASGWLTPIGVGAFIMLEDKLDWQGALFSLQSQVNFPAHVGALTALTIHGRAHYARSEEKAFLFAERNRQLPLWFRNQPWYQSISFHRANFISDEALGINPQPYKTFTLKTSEPERAIIETLYLTPKHIDWTEAYQLMEGLPTLRPALLQKILMQCSSIRIKRLFLFMASKIGHAWHRHLSIDTLDLGSGERSLVHAGVYIPEFRITVPRELATQ